MNRRQFLKACGQVTAACAIAGIGTHQYGKHIEADWLALEQIQIPINNLLSGLEGFKIVQLSDIHIDSYTEIETVEAAIALTNNLQPDLIVLTGDYISHQVGAMRELTPLLARLKAKYGTFAILGNHELWTDAPFIQAQLEKAGLPVLVNEGVVLNVGPARLYLAGVDDCWSGQPDLQVALAHLPPDTPTILLAHEPDFADQFAQDGRVSLQLSGHSHGGQVRLPGYGAFILPPHGRKYDQGLYQVNDMWLYTNRGLGLGPVSYRINCSPEVTEITLIGQAGDK